MAPQLVIGGLPRSRLPLLLALVALTDAVLAATVWLVHRDRALSRLRNDFVARVSHELRTPLTQIRLYAETLLLGRVQDGARQRDYLAIINRESQRLGHLVDNVLTFSGREKSAPALEVAAVDLGELLEDVVAGYGPLAAAHGDRLVVDREDNLVGRLDREAVRQVLLNLLDNACKYGPRGQSVQARAWAEGSRVCIAVEDRGPGIPDGDKHRVWSPYFRLDRDERRAVNGAGIGLSVARDLILAMGGDYRVEDAEPEGCRIVISFPARSP